MKPKPKPALTKAPTKQHPVAPVVTPIESAAHTDRVQTRLFSTRLPDDLHWEVKRAALEHHLSVQQLVTDALRAHLKQL
jgi:predicted HicB family RNase H-like nuclease